MAIDLFKAIEAAKVPAPLSQVFQRNKVKPKQSFIEYAAGMPGPASSVFNWPGQKEQYTAPIARTVPAGSEPTTSEVLASPAERAYAAEKMRVAQMTAQNPELQRYEVARQAAAAQNAPADAVQKAEDLGMQIWAQKYAKTLAPKVKPGQAGYEVIQNTLNAGTMGPVMDLPFAPASLLGEGAMQNIPSYAGASDLQPVGTPLQPSDFGTPENQFKAQMFNRLLSEKAQPPVISPPTNPSEATYASAGNVQPIGGISLEDTSFSTPAAQRRAALFTALLARANAR